MPKARPSPRPAALAKPREARPSTNAATSTASSSATPTRWPTTPPSRWRTSTSPHLYTPLPPQRLRARQDPPAPRHHPAHLAANPQARVRYVAAEAFTNEYIASVRPATSSPSAALPQPRPALPRRHPLLSRKNATRVEPAHLRRDRDRRLAPRARLRRSPRTDRIAHPGPHQPPALGHGRQDPDPRRALRKRLVVELASRRGLRLDQAAVQLIEDPSRGEWTVRELEGALTASSRPPTSSPTGPRTARSRCTSSRRALGEPSQHPIRAIRFDHIRDAVCSTLEVEHRIWRERQAQSVVMRACRHHRALQADDHAQLPEIARKLGKTNHSTVITAPASLSKWATPSHSACPSTA